MVECQPNQNNSTTITSTEKGTTSIEIKLQNIYGYTPIIFIKEITIRITFARSLTNH